MTDLNDPIIAPKIKEMLDAIADHEHGFIPNWLVTIITSAGKEIHWVAYPEKPTEADLASLEEEFKSDPDFAYMHSLRRGRGYYFDVSPIL